MTMIEQEYICSMCGCVCESGSDFLVHKGRLLCDLCYDDEVWFNSPITPEHAEEVQRVLESDYYYEDF